MTLEMPSEPLGTPGGLFVCLDPPQEASPFDDDVYPLPDPSPNRDFVMDFEPDLNSSFEVVGGEALQGARENELTPRATDSHSVPPVAPVSTQPSRMPTIHEEDEKGEEEGDVTITPNEAQRALLPPDRFARPPSVSQVAGTEAASQDMSFDELDTPRPGGELIALRFILVVTLVTDPCGYVYAPTAQASLFAPASDLFGEADPNTSQDSLSEIDRFFSLMIDKATNPDFDGSLDVDIPAWNEAVFGELSSQGSTPSSSSSSWESTSKEGPSTEMGAGADIDMGVRFPSVGVDATGGWVGMPTQEEFLRAIVEAAQSSPKTVSPISCSVLSSRLSVP